MEATNRRLLAVQRWALTLFVGHLDIPAQAVPEGGVVVHCGVDKQTARHGHGSLLQGRLAGGRKGGNGFVGSCLVC